MMIKYCIQIVRKVGYETVKYMLYQVYGDPHRVIKVYGKEIKRSQIRPEDAEGCKTFQPFLLMCGRITNM